MKIQEIIDIKSMVMEKLDNEPENAFDFFKEKWKKLTFNDKEIAGMHIRQSCLNILQIPNSSSWTGSDELMRLNCSLIYNYIQNELEGKHHFSNLKCGDKINPVDIASVFKLLYDLKYLDNTLPEIEEVITQVFNFPNQNTIKSYLNDTSKLKIAAKEFKKLVNSSSLARD